MEFGSGVPNVLQMLINMSASFPVILKLIVTVSAFLGMVMFASALVRLNRFYAAQDGRAGSGPVLSPTEAGTKMIFGAILTIPVWAMAITGNTIISGAATSSGAFLYPDGASDMQKAAMDAIYGLLAIVGYVGFISGFRILDRHYSNNDPNAHTDAGVWRIVGGVCCVYMQPFASLLSDWTGFNLANFVF